MGDYEVRLYENNGFTILCSDTFNVEVGGGLCTDAYEPNDYDFTAYGPLTSGDSYDAKICSATDVDWYKIEVGSAGDIDLTLVPPQGYMPGL